MPRARRSRLLEVGHVELEEAEAGSGDTPSRRGVRQRARLCNPRAPWAKARAMIRRALTNTGWLMGARGINAVLSLGYLALATRALGLEGFGQFMLAVPLLAQAVAGLASFQTWQAVVRWGHERETRARRGRLCARARPGDRRRRLDRRRRCCCGFAGDWLPVPPATAARGVRADRRHAARGPLDADRNPAPARPLRARRDRRLGHLGGAAGRRRRRVPARPTSAAFVIVLGRRPSWPPRSPTGASRCARGRCSLRKISLTRLPRAEKGAWRFVWGTGPLGRAADRLAADSSCCWSARSAAPALAGIYRVAAQLGEGLLKLAQALLRATYPELVRDPDAARAHRRADRPASRVITGVVTVVFGALAGHWVIMVVAGREYLAAYGPMLILAGAACDRAGRRAARGAAGGARAGLDATSCCAECRRCWRCSRCRWRSRAAAPAARPPRCWSPARCRSPG